MAPMRRRLSKRVVKSTFQECFEYDLPGHRIPEPKRASLPEGRTRTSISEKIKQESNDEKVVSDKNLNKVPKTKSVTTKESSKDETTKKRTSENIKVKGKESVKIKGNEISKTQGISKKLVTRTSAKLLKIKSSVGSRIKAKNAFLGSDYKRFKSPQIKTKNKTPSQAQETEGNVRDGGSKGETKTASEATRNSPSTTGKVLVSTNWQPVVHLEKISVNDPKALRSGSKGKEISSRHQQPRNSTRSPDLATRLRNALKDPLAEQEDKESAISDNGISNSMVVEEVFASSHPHAGPSMLLDFEDSVYGEKKNLRNSPLERVFRDDVLPKQPGSDSALEDWPESSSENSDGEETKEENFVLDDSAITDWSGPHVNVILHWQKKFNSVTNELRNSFDSLRSIIEEKNSLIAALKNKLDSFNDSTCHKILDRILLDYDKHDPKKPATMIINSILEY
ncbi:Protein of unknown function [Gryllus bimaculatus]|nr:Protein of unknown function [Gryllus bimaculatus]